MGLKMFSIRNASMVFIAALVLALVSCAPRVIAPSRDSVRLPAPAGEAARKPATQQPSPAEQPRAEPEAEPKPRVQQPRMTASLQLTQQAQSLIGTRQADSAIRLLEKAVAIDPLNGQNYYYLSEAWLMKGNRAQAENFNEMASIYLDSDEKWRPRIADQKRRIKKLAN